jgi:SAM-dependent methyltransferase
VIDRFDFATSTARSESQYFDSLVASEGDFNPFQDGAWETLRRRWIALAAPQNELTILDVGCGTGHSQRLYRGRARRFVGLDLSKGALSIARSHAPGDDWIRGDATTLPFADASFDMVAFSSVLHHMPDFPTALRESARVVKAGGVVFAFDPNLLHPAMALFREPRSPFYSPLGVSPNERPLMPGALRRAFRDADLVDVRQRCQSNIAYRAVAPKALNAALGIYNVLDRLFEYSGLGRWFGAFVLTVGRKRG